MSDLYWLTDEQMARLEPYFPKSHGKPRVDDRRVLSGIVFVNRNGLRWCDAPREYGSHKTLYNRWKRWGDLPSAARDRGWLIGSTMPLMLQRAGITLRVIPSLILLPKFLPPTPEALVVLLEAALRKAVDAGLRDLDRIGQQARNLDTMGVTKRSKAPLLARLQIAYPGLQFKAIARLLGVTPQGARKLLATKGPVSRPVRV